MATIRRGPAPGLFLYLVVIQAQGVVIHAIAPIAVGRGMPVALKGGEWRATRLSELNRR
jgi:hypothetical protein